MQKRFHKNNVHNEKYNFKLLAQSLPSLSKHIVINRYGDQSIDFSNNESVLELNKAILKFFYKVDNWSIPKGHLCPPIPGRVDYIHYINDILEEEQIEGKITALDIGVGTGCIYPLVGVALFDWNFIATDISNIAIENSRKIINANESFVKKIECRLQKDSTLIFKGVIDREEKITITMCNPPFHKSLSEAKTVSNRKIRNLNRNKIKKGHTLEKEKITTSSNFGGKDSELWCPGGELQFIGQIINESIDYKKNIKWFTTLVSQKENLPKLRSLLSKQKPEQIKVIPMSHGQKKAHILAWKY